MRDIAEDNAIIQCADGVSLGLIVQAHGDDSILQGWQIVIVNRDFIEMHLHIERLVGVPDKQDSTQYGNASKSPSYHFAGKLPFMTLPNGIELHTQKFGDKLHVCTFAIKPRQMGNLLMNVGTQDFRQTELVDNRIKAFLSRVATMRNTINDEEMDVFGAS